MLSKKRVLLVMAISLLVMLAAVVVVQAQSPSCDNRVNNTHAKLLECVTGDGVRAHQEAFQAIAPAVEAGLYLVPKVIE